MKKDSFGKGLVVFLLIVWFFFVIDTIREDSEPRCIKTGCDNKQASGSSYCYLHKPCTGSSTSHSRSSYSYKSSSGTSTKGSSNSSYSNKSNVTSNSSYNSSTKKSTTKKSTTKSTTKKKSTYDSYDDGYDDFYMGGDYDYDRYDSDSEYADGVEDAMDEFGED
jgi:hypothetical protein